MFRNIFSIIVSIDAKDVPQKTPKLTYGILQQWIEENHSIKVSKSSISQVKNKCGLSELDYGMMCDNIPYLNTEKEKAVLEAFKHFEIVKS